MQPKKNREVIKKRILITSYILIGILVILSYLKIDTSLNKNIINARKKEMIIYEKTPLKEAINKIYDAVVLIENNNDNNTGTGFVYKVDNYYGYILTNEHVIKSNSVKITFSNDNTSQATLLGKDEYLDLAVLRVEKKYITQIATLGSSDNLSIGDTVFTVGSPLGYEYRGSVTLGIISGKDRLVKTTVNNYSTDNWLMKVIQTDASINPGNSGGPLVNVNGDVIGICTLKLVDEEVEGMSFAIPIEYAINHLNELENGKKIEWPSLNIKICNSNDYATLTANSIEINSNQTGVVVTKVEENTNAYQAGLQKGDIITEINNIKIKDISYLRYEVYKYKKNDQVELKIIRNNNLKTIKLILQ